MVQHYTLITFLRSASKNLIAEYLKAKDIDLGIDLAALGSRETEPLVGAIEQISEAKQVEINCDFQKIQMLANQAGLLQIVQEARLQGIDIIAGLETQKSLVNRAFWTYLKFPHVFDGAAQFAVPYLSGRYWKRGLPIPHSSVDDLGKNIKALEDAISAYFRCEEGRGKACRVDYRKRGATHQFHAFPEDYPAAPLAWSKIGLEPHPFRPAFEIVFVFHQNEGSLDIYFEGGKVTVERLWQMFAATVLGIERLQKTSKPTYALERLKARNFAFVRPPDSPIMDVRVKRLGFAILGVPATKVSIETDVSRDPDAIHDMIGRTFAQGILQPGRFALSQTKVISAGLRVMIDPRDGGAPRIRSFDLSEKSCSLKYEGADLLLRQMLTDSGIDQTGVSADVGQRTPRQVA